MRKGFLSAVAMLIGSTLAYAQQWPTYGYPQMPAYGYPQYPGSGYQQYPGYYPGYYAPRPGGYYPGYQQWTPQQVQVNSALVYPRAGYATPNYPVSNIPQGSAYSSPPPPRVVTLPQTVVQTVPEPLPTGPETGHSTSTPLVPEPAHVLPPPSSCGGACDHNDLLVPPKEPCRPACKHECFWVAPSFIMAWTKPGIAVPLVTTGFVGVGGVGGDQIPGALGQPNTSVLFGQNPVDFGLIPGIKLEAGLWLDRENRFSVDASGFYLPQVHQGFHMASDSGGNPLITRPIFNPISGMEESFIVAFPGTVSGAININNTQTIWGAEINARWHEPIGRNFKLESLMGLRYFSLRESLNISEAFQPLVGAGAAGLTFLANTVDPPNSLFTTDAFSTTNNFYGFQLGGVLHWENARFFVDALAKAAVGVNQQSVNIGGSSFLLGPTGQTLGTASGGILALPSNIGNHARTVVSVLPEGGISGGVNITSWLRAQAGYTFMYLNNVVRPTGSIDRTINPNQVPTDADFSALGGPARPGFQFREEGFWIHIFSVGLEFHY